MPGEHWVLFQRNPQYLSAVLGHYVARGVELGEAVVLVAAEAHMAPIEARLMAEGLPVAELKASGQLTILSAERTLAAITGEDGRVDPDRFDRVVGALLREKTARFLAVRAFGEMVDLLRKQGRIEEFLELEDIWHVALARMPLVLICAYGLDGLSGEAGNRILERIYDCHTRLLPVEELATVQDFEQINRYVLDLQRNTGVKGALRLGQLELDPGRQSALLREEGGEERNLELTPYEFRILYWLARHPSRYFTTTELLAELWPRQLHVGERTIYSHIYSLRKKLGKSARLIDACKGRGYRLEAGVLQ